GPHRHFPSFPPRRSSDLRVLADGARRAVELGYGDAADLDRIESGGRIDGADPDEVSPAAKGRGHDQLGTIGSGNHFVEIDVVERSEEHTSELQSLAYLVC